MPGSSLSIPESTWTIRTWAILPGVREWALVVLVVIALYGRSRPARIGRFFAPLERWVRPSRPRLEPAWIRWVVDRWPLVLALLAGVGIAAWLATSLRVARHSS